MKCRKESCQYHDDRMTDNCAKGEPPDVANCPDRKPLDMTDILVRLEDMHNKRYNSNWAAWVQTQCSEGSKEIRRLRAEVDRLRGALEWIAKGEHRVAVEPYIDCAKKALAAGAVQPMTNKDVLRIFQPLPEKEAKLLSEVID